MTLYVPAGDEGGEAVGECRKASPAEVLAEARRLPGAEVVDTDAPGQYLNGNNRYLVIALGVEAEE